jgi:hypothetical protein
MFLVPTKSWIFKVSPYEILMVILVLQNILVCKNSLYFENILQKLDNLVLQNILVCKNSLYFENILQKLDNFSPPK